MATAYQRRTAARRATSGIDRLASEFDKRMRELSGQQAESFGAYTRQVAETMAPYEQQMDQYRTTLLPEYEKQRQSYQQSLEAFQAQLEEIKKNPTVTKTEQVEMPRGGIAGFLGRTKTVTQEYQEPRPVPTFEQVAPVAPAIPEAPKIGEFETAGFEQKRKQLQSDLQRELGERRGAKLAAVQRRPRGGLMQGA
jgi:hypothetical protein